MCHILEDIFTAAAQTEEVFRWRDERKQRGERDRNMILETTEVIVWPVGLDCSPRLVCILISCCFLCTSIARLSVLYK